MKRYNQSLKYIVIFLLVGFFSNSLIKAQEVSTLHFMRLSPYVSFTNPAKNIPYNGYIGIPILGNINLQLQNSSLHFDKLFRYGSDGQPEAILLNNFVDNLNPDKNWLNANLNIELLGFGFRYKNNFFTISNRLRVQQYFEYSQDLFKLPLQGNGNYMGTDNPANLNLAVNGQAYVETSLGYQRQINKKLSVGGRVKLLTGIYNVETNSINAKIYTDEETYGVRVFYDMDVRFALIAPFEINNYKFEISSDKKWTSPFFKNLGFGMDLGADYKITDKIGVSAAVNDLGFITWKTNTQSIKSTVSDVGDYYDDGSFYFQGFTMDELQKIVDDSAYRRNFLDTLKQYFPMSNTQISQYSTSLNTNFNIEGYYDINEMHRFSVLFQGTLAYNTFYPALTVAYDGNFFKMIDVCVHYTMMNKNYDNLGFGVGVHLGPINIYATASNMIQIFNPYNAKNLSFQLGMVVHWGGKSNKTTDVE